MTRRLTRRRLLRTAIVLLVVGLAARLYLVSLVFAVGGDAALSLPVLRVAELVLLQVVFPLGLALVAMLIIVRVTGRDRAAGAASSGSHRAAGAVSSGSAVSNGSSGEETVPPAAPVPRAVTRMLWGGVSLTALGLVVRASFEAWQYDISGGADVASLLARDLLWLLGAPLDAVALPFGILLIAGSLVARVDEPAVDLEHSLRQTRTDPRTGEDPTG